ncbi:unnamed protein product [Dovyalis caffra]|uniref:Uncharacterized protein n=1 Tax=Dovyalis caffra TaxID=77055 RepID=A0AAV1R4Y0_9ROSI|nr:unnamed protein product [Dovyalis caffra]
MIVSKFWKPAKEAYRFKIRVKKERNRRNTSSVAPLSLESVGQGIDDLSPRIGLGFDHTQLWDMVEVMDEDEEIKASKQIRIKMRHAIEDLLQAGLSLAATEPVGARKEIPKVDHDLLDTPEGGLEVKLDGIGENPFHDAEPVSNTVRGGLLEPMPLS